MEVTVYYSFIALIPARLGSSRLPMKNIRILGGHPLLAYAIQSAKDSGLFQKVCVSSDSVKIGEVASHYGAEFIMRPEKYAQDLSPDIEWICHAFETIGGICHAYAIVRPTSPFRTGDTIKRAFEIWDKYSLMKAVEPVEQHPAKMWKCFNGEMRSYINNKCHLLPTQAFERLYVQNGSLEFRKVLGTTLSYQPFFTQGYEGYDINTVNDWILAESLLNLGLASPPKIEKEPYDLTAI